jgi:hypothetical protein
MRVFGAICTTLGGFLLIALAVSGGGGGLLPATPPPIPGIAKAFLVVHDQANRRNLKPDQLAVLTSTILVDKLNQNGFQSRYWDKSNVLNGTGPIAEAGKKVLAENKPLPWMLISNETAGKGYSGPVETLDGALKHVDEVK